MVRNDRTCKIEDNRKNSGRTYIAIDLKSFYASVECTERGLDPLTTNLVVADESRTEKTICLAVSPSLKAYGIPGRARLFEVIQRVKEVNASRRTLAPEHHFTGESWSAPELAEHPELAVSWLTAVPRMAHYIEYSTRIYQIYLKYIAPEDIHVYSIDEVIMDVTDYLDTYRMTAHELAMRMIRDVLSATGITATAGIGTNMYLCKIAMDIVAKHVEPDADGVRIAELDEMSYRRLLWNHRPLTDFWRVGRGYAKKLEQYGMFTMGDVARCSVQSEETLYRLFGVNAELLIDHAWGWEPCTMAAVKAYKPETNSFSSGQVLTSAYSFGKARLVVREMADTAALDLVDRHLVTDQLVLTVGYDIGNLTGKYECEVVGDLSGHPGKCSSGADSAQSRGGWPSEAGRSPGNPTAAKEARAGRSAGDSMAAREAEAGMPGGRTADSGEYQGIIVTDRYGRKIPKHAHGTVNLEHPTSSSRRITEAVLGLYDRIVDPKLTVRRLNISVNHVADESAAKAEASDGEYEQMDLFTDYAAREKQQAEEAESLAKERKMQEAMLAIKKKFGKNAILKGSSLEEGATARQRNEQIGGHRK